VNVSRYISKKIQIDSPGTFTGKIIKIAIAGIALGFAVILISSATVEGFQREISSKITGFSGDIEIRATGSASNNDYPMFQIPESFVSELHKLDNIKSIHAVATKPAIIKSQDELLGILYKGVDSNYAFDFYQNNLLEGEMPLKQNEILISKFMAQKLQVKVGEKLRIYFIKQPIRASAPIIKGIYHTGLDEQDKMIVLGNIATVQRFFSDGANFATNFEVYVQDLNKLESTKEEVSKNLDYSLDCHLSKELFPQIYTWLDYLDLNKWIILSLMFFVSAICLVSALLILVIDRTKMIGLLKTLGATNALIKQIFMYKLARILAWGFGLGNLLGLGLCFFQKYTSYFKLDQETYYIDTVPIYLNLSSILLANLIGISICMLVLMLPVQMVSKINPSKSIRFD
jgi:lipoprotein-releasing system permease protein